MFFLLVFFLYVAGMYLAFAADISSIS